jgi:uncharacterized protein YecE (DUF72 family)
MIKIGTSGWNYDHWKGEYYSEQISDEHLLSHYEKTFDTVEVNATFYSLPEKKTVEKWCDTVADDFTFSVKASRYITHMKKLKDPEEPLNNFFEVADSFGNQLGPVLFQLPPNWNVNPERLSHFLQELPDEYSSVFEFRDRSWHCEEVYDLLKEHNASLCFYDLEKMGSPEVQTASHLYVRMHGPLEEAYKGSYSDDTLADLAKKLMNWSEQGKPVYCYFNNDDEAHAPENAKRLKELLNEV